MVNPVLAGILGVLALFGLAALTGFFLWRWEARDLDRWDREQRLERERLARPSLRHLCAADGHRYEKVDPIGWRCPVCGEYVVVINEDGVA